MEWNQVVSLILSSLSFLGIGSGFAYFVTERCKKNKSRYDKGVKEERTEEIKEAIKPLIDVINNNIDRLNSDVKKIQQDIELVKQGEQASLRHNLLEIYSKWQPLGYCPQDVKDDFENQYQKYHKLGANGVMDTYRKTILRLPVKFEEKKYLKESI